MAESVVRVALLARPGDARDQLRRALAELGAELVAEGDPGELDPAAVAGHSPTVVLVSLEPAIEDALDRFGDLFATPGVEVMFDDAEVTRQLDGWDLARWARHLAAKLVGGDLLPPVPGDADALPEMDLAPEPGAPPTPAEVMANEKLEDYAAESLDLSEWVPTQPSLADEPQPEAAAAPAPADEEVIDLELDIGDLEQALGRIDAEVGTEPRAPAAGEDLEFDASVLDIDLSALPEEGARMVVANEPALDIEEPLLADITLSDEPVSFSSFSEDDVAAAAHLDDDVAALAAQLEAFEANDQRETAREPDFTLAFDAKDAPAAAPSASPAATGPAAAKPAPARAGIGFSNLELVPMDGDAPAAEPVAVAFAPPSSAALDRGNGLSLAAEDAKPSQSISSGALLVLAGLGGPDAVRQLLAGLPPTLPVPVLLYQHLDTGKHDRLVDQLAKASQLPLDLAVEGKLAFPGRVSVLVPGLGARFEDGSLQFTAGGQLADVVAALPAAESGVLVLSGADPTLVPAVLKLMAEGGLVLAQDPAACFDPTAADAVQRAGATAATPADLAARVSQRWH
ncbi:MAG: hypothetical protein NDI68_00940 [Arenimonas sp.]|nr:hypothetical protein [Arenimonas sp.]